MSKEQIPPFLPWSEASMAFLASRPEEWRIWSLEDYEFLTLSTKRGISGFGLLRRKQRTLLSVLPADLKTARWRAAFLSQQSSPSATVSRLLHSEDNLSHKARWLRYVRSFTFEDDLEIALSEVAHLLEASRCDNWRAKIRVLKMSKKDSRGRFFSGSQITQVQVYENDEECFRGSPEDLPELLYN